LAFLIFWNLVTLKRERNKLLNRRSPLSFFLSLQNEKVNNKKVIQSFAVTHLASQKHFTQSWINISPFFLFCCLQQQQQQQQRNRKTLVKLS
jgi:hypothetical protein